jgi:hypothetical protein
MIAISGITAPKSKQDNTQVQNKLSLTFERPAFK